MIERGVSIIKKKKPFLRRIFVLAGIVIFGLATVITFSANNHRSGPLALVNGMLIDGTGADPIPRATLIVKNGKITAAGKTGEVVIPKDATIIDISNKTVLPGFINAHVHGAFNPARLAEWAQSGVTSVRDMSANGKTIAEIKKLRNQLDRPDCARLFSAGLMIGVLGGYGCLYVTSSEDARAKVLKLIDAGVDAIKVSLEDGYAGRSGLPKLSSEELRVIIETAHERDKRVTIHITQAQYLEQAVTAGVDEMAHISWDPIPIDVLKRMVRANIYMVPTFTIFRYYNAPVDQCILNLHNFIQAGGRVALGNDTGGLEGYEPGMPMFEIECMQKAGMTPMEIIVSATRNGAYVCDQAENLGTLEKGKIADLFVVDGNPLQDMNVLRKVTLVLKEGKIIRDRINK